MTTNLTTFIHIYDNDKNDHGYYQNSLVGEKITPGGHPFAASDSYTYLSFIYQGSTQNRSGDNNEAAIVLANNELSMGHAINSLKGIVNNPMGPHKFSNWVTPTYIDVFVCLMRDNGTTWQFESVLTRDTWLVSSVTYDAHTVEIILAGAIDAVGLEAPYRVYTNQIVGNLPITGEIVNR